jgi:hypothetical protein
MTSLYYLTLIADVISTVAVIGMFNHSARGCRMLVCIQGDQMTSLWYVVLIADVFAIVPVVVMFNRSARANWVQFVYMMNIWRHYHVILIAGVISTFAVIVMFNVPTRGRRVSVCIQGKHDVILSWGFNRWRHCHSLNEKFVYINIIISKSFLTILVFIFFLAPLKIHPKDLRKNNICVLLYLY